MGVDLTILPEKYPGDTYNRLNFNNRYYDLYKELDKFSTPVQKDIAMYEDEGIKYRRENPYGDKITFVTAYQFIRVFERIVKENVSEWDQAILAFLSKLNPETKVVLLYH